MERRESFMKRYLFASCAVLALALSSGPASWAKPADLPSHNQIECPDGIDDPLLPPPGYQVEADRELPAKTKPAPMDIDAVGPAMISACFEQIVKHLNEAIAAANKQIEQDAAKTRSLELRLFDPVNVRIEQVPFKQAIKNLASM